MTTVARHSSASHQLTQVSEPRHSGAVQHVGPPGPLQAGVHLLPPVPDRLRIGLRSCRDLMRQPHPSLRHCRPALVRRIPGLTAAPEGGHSSPTLGPTCHRGKVLSVVGHCPLTPLSPRWHHGGPRSNSDPRSSAVGRPTLLSHAPGTTSTLGGRARKGTVTSSATARL